MRGWRGGGGAHSGQIWTITQMLVSVGVQKPGPRKYPGMSACGFTSKCCSSLICSVFDIITPVWLFVLDSSGIGAEEDPRLSTDVKE